MNISKANKEVSGFKTTLLADIGLRKSTSNGILLPKLFWPTVRKNVLVIEKKLLKFKAENLQKIWDH